jgi:hypothetical protein
LVEYFGGPVIPNPKVYVIWWGDPAQIRTSLTAADGGIRDFIAAVTNSGYVDWWSEYNTTIVTPLGSHAGDAGTQQRIGRGNYAGTFTLNQVPLGTIDDVQVRARLDQAFSANDLPAPDENSLYAIFFPPSVRVNVGSAAGCTSFYAYHDAIIETQRHNVFYVVVPDCGKPFSFLTVATSHELAEAMTDAIPAGTFSADYPQAWADTGADEVGDLCVTPAGPLTDTLTTPVGAFSVQKIWDEKSQGCLTFRSEPQDFNVAITPNTSSLSAGRSGTFTVNTSTVAGQPHSLSLSVSAPAGVAASLAPNTVMSGQTSTLTVTINGRPTGSSQVIVRADLTTVGVVQTHTASLLISSGDGGVPPEVSIQTPATGATVSDGVTVSATATSPTGITVASLVLNVDGHPVSNSTASPLTFQWDTRAEANGAHTLIAVATDSDGLSATSPPVAVTVINASTPDSGQSSSVDSGTDSDAGCVPGTAGACRCDDGQPGSLFCQSDGGFSNCACDKTTADGGAPTRGDGPAPGCGCGSNGNGSLLAAGATLLLLCVGRGRRRLRLHALAHRRVSSSRVLIIAGEPPLQRVAPANERAPRARAASTRGSIGR